MRSKRELEISLTKLESFLEPSIQLEQYATPAHIAADWAWNMAMRSEVAGKTFLDAACGPGILGLGLLLMGAKKVYFLDSDSKIMQTCAKNYNQLLDQFEIGQAEFITEDISLFDEIIDIVIQNPPFGTKDKHADRKFLETAFRSAKVVYSMHKFSTKKFIESISRDYDFTITHLWRYQFPIKQTFKHHLKPVIMVDVAVWRMESAE